MWGLTIFFVCCVAVQVMSHEVEVKCQEFHGFPPASDVACPSALANLKVKLVTVKDVDMLNISWAINIDASIRYLTATRIGVSGEPSYHCTYHPPLNETGLTNQTWFYHLVRATYGFTEIEAANLPLPPLNSNFPSNAVTIRVPKKKPTTTTTTPLPVTTAPVTPESTFSDRAALKSEIFIVCILGGLIGLLVLLSSCYAIYRICGSHNTTVFGFNTLLEAQKVVVPVLVVYPAENPAFQRVVVELAEFLQWHGGCRVAVDMWQQGKIAELGPMRWLAEQAKAADRVLIVCPQPSSQPSHCPPSLSAPEASIPAAAHDLYPLILNMVASHAKCASELSKFWVVQLGKQQNNKPTVLPVELRACKTFCLMKDLNKLCKSLSAQRQGSRKTSALLFKPGVSYSKKNTVKLMEAIRKLKEYQSSISGDYQPLVSTV